MFLLTEEMAPKTEQESVTLRWLGVSGLTLQHRDAVLALDPFVTRPPLRRLFAGRVEPDEAWPRDCSRIARRY